MDSPRKNKFNGKINNLRGKTNRVRTWYHGVDNQDTRSRNYKSTKDNLQKRYESEPGFGNKRASPAGNNGQQESEQEGSRDDIGKSMVNNILWKEK